ncbi:hypothetical protein JYT51_01290 [Candidatus Amoebophilus asiaticus]|nr:hypothetical protein [Candidatus Amoebophilus asiaticus]
MSIKTKHAGKNQIYFCTFTCYKWLHLFDEVNFYNNIYNWFNILKRDKNEILGYIIMPNHLHFLIFLDQESKEINKIVANGKRFMAYEIVKILKTKNRNNFINILSKGVHINERRKGKLHQVFQPSFDCKICLSEEFIIQKLEYMHHNPVSGKWNLVDDYIDYLHSSAKFYETGITGLYEVTDYREAINKVILEV